MPAMETDGGKTAAFAAAKQLLLQCGLCQQWRVGAIQLLLQCGLCASANILIRISEFSYTEVLYCTTFTVIYSARLLIPRTR